MELHGRRPLYTSYPEVTPDNVTSVLAEVIGAYRVNAMEEEYLDGVYRSKMDIAKKEKSTRPDINHKVTENRAFQIADFWTGTMVGDPIVYTSRSGEVEKITLLNDMMLYENKEAGDKELFDWMHITGHGYRMVLPDTEGETPFSIYTLEPMRTGVIYYSGIGHRKLAGFYVTLLDDGMELWSVYTPRYYIEVLGGDSVVSVEEHPLNGVPIFEYCLNKSRMGVFEPVMDLLNAINYVDSDRMDAVTTFVNSLVVLYNAKLPEGEDGNTIREQGLICLQSNEQNKADIKILSEQLNQTATQTLKSDMYSAVLQIVGMPDQSTGGGTDSSNNGAMFLKQGYQLTEMRAKGEEAMFKKTEREMLNMVLYLCRNLRDLDLLLSDVDVTFTRRAYADIVSKSTVLTTLLSNEYVDKLDAWKISGISPDPEECFKRGMENYKNVHEIRRAEPTETEVNTDRDDIS